VAPASQFEILDSRRAPGGVRLDVVEFQEASFRAAAVRAHEGALAAIASPDLSLETRGYVAGPAWGCACCSWAVGGGQFRPFQIRQQRCQRPIEDRSRVAARNAMAEQVLHAPQLLERLAPNGELHLVSFRGEWRDLGARGRGNDGNRRDCDLL
jgi:hypothetical protein